MSDECFDSIEERCRYMAQVAKVPAMKNTLTSAADTIEALLRELQHSQNKLKESGRTKLREQLATMTAERDALAKDKAAFCMQYRMDCDVETKELEEEIARLKAKCDPVRDYERSNQLAATQAREQQLREALRCVEQACVVTGAAYSYMTKALALPQDTTALKQYGAKLLREARNKLIEICDRGVGATLLKDMADELEAKK